MILEALLCLWSVSYLDRMINHTKMLLSASRGSLLSPVIPSYNLRMVIGPIIPVRHHLMESFTRVGRTLSTVNLAST